MADLKTNLKKILSFVLAVVMLVGVIPAVFKFQTDVKAETPVDSLENGFVQGENDLVILMQTGKDVPMYTYASAMGAKFKGSIVHTGTENIGAGVDAKENPIPFDRLIFVFQNETQITTTASGSKKQVILTGWAKTEYVIWTSKCTITNPDYVYEFSYDTAAKVVKSTTATKGLVNHYNNADSAQNGKINIFHRAGSTEDLVAARIYMGCNLHWDYLTVNTANTTKNNSGHYPVIDAHGCDLRIGKNVDIVYFSGKTQKFIITNDQFTENQTIEILGGDYSGIAPYPLKVDLNPTANNTLSGTLNVKLDGITVQSFTGYSNFFVRPYVFANADMAETAVINYEINNVTYLNFTDSLCVFGGRKFTNDDTYRAGVAPVAAGTINLTIRNTELPYGIGDSATNSNAYLRGYKFLEQGSGFRLNVALGRGTTVDADVDLEGFNNDYCATTVYVYDEEITDSIKLPEKNGYVEPLTCVHVFNAIGETVDGDYTLSLSCNKCGFTREFDIDKNGHPAVYVDALTGNDNYLGDSIATAVQSMSRASQILAKWGVGGTIVVIDGHNNREYASGFEAINTAGGTITITSSTNDFIVGRKVDYRETAGACWVPYVNVWAYEDIVLENLIVVSDRSTHALYLGGRDFVIDASCDFREYTDIKLLDAGNRPAYGTDPATTVKLAIVTGYNPSDGYIDSRPDDIGTQNIVLVKGNFALVVFGNRYARLTSASNYEEESLKPLSGNVNVYIGKDAIVTNIDALPEKSALNPTFVFENGVDYEIATELPTTADVNIKAKADVVNAEKDHVVIVNNENFAFVQNSVKWENNQASVRVENVVSADWMEENVAELGFFIKEYDNAPFAAYFADADLEDDKVNAKDGVGKSLAYDKQAGKNLYFYKSGSTEVIFRGVLEFDKKDGETILNADKEFIAVPYAVLNDGTFINGAAEVFTLHNVCDTIIADENASEKDKDKAGDILAALPEFKYPDIHNEGTAEEPYVITPVYEAVVAYFDPATAPANLTADQKAGATVELSGSTGISSFTAKKSGSGTREVAIEADQGGDKLVRLKTVGENTYCYFDFQLDSPYFAKEDSYDVTVTYRLGNGFTCTDSTGRAVLFRAFDGALTAQYNEIIVSNSDLASGTDYTNWQTAEFTINTNKELSRFGIFIFAADQSYIDIKSIEFRKTLPVDEIPDIGDDDSEGGGNVTPDPDDTELPTPVVPDADAIKIACMGDSLTAGVGVDPALRAYYSYPAQLQSLLGSGYNVLNCGRSGATVLTNGSKYFNGGSNAYHYGSVQKHKDAQAFAPDIAIIMLGTNDAPRYIDKVGDDPAKQAEFKAEFVAELTSYGKTMEDINPDVKVYLMLCTPYENDATKSQNLVDNIHPIIRQVAMENGWEIIDLYSVIAAANAKGEAHFSDGLHFTKDGYAIVAKTVYDAITAVGEPMPEPTVASVVYVSNSGTGDGLTPQNPTDLASALGMTKAAGGKIVLVDAVKLPYNKSKSGVEEAVDNKYYFPSNKNTVTITTVDNGVDYGTSKGASLTLNGHTYFYGDYEFNNIKLVSGISDIKIFCQYNDITFGENVTTDKGSYNLPAIYAGYHADSGLQNGVYDYTCHEDGKLVIKSGTWDTVIGGNWRRYANSPMGTIDSGVKYNIFISGGKVNNGICAFGENSIEEGAEVYFEINGGVVSGTSYLGAGRGSEGVDGISQNQLGGKVTLKIVGDSQAELGENARPWVNGDINAYKTGSGYTIGTNGLMTLVLDGGRYTKTPVINITTISNSSTNRARFKLVYGSKNTLSDTNIISNIVTGDAACAAITAPTLVKNAPVYTTHPAVRDGLNKTEMTTSEIESWTSDRTQSQAALEEVAKLENGTGKDYNAAYDNARTLKGETAANYSLDKIVSVKFVELLTGEYSINRTNTNYSIGSAGGGYMVDCGDYVLVAFGDTEWEKDLDSAGKPSQAIQNSKEYGGPWRANTLSFTTDFDYTDGILIDDFYSIETGIGDYEGRAIEFLKSEHRDGSEMSKIPTGGVLVDGVLYFGYMSVRNWTEDDDNTGVWDCNYGGIAISRDYGRTWETPSDLTWPATVGEKESVTWNTQNGHVTEELYTKGYAQPYPVVSGNYLYVFSVPGGRKGDVKLMRVPLAEIENKAAYEYFVGRDENGDAIYKKGYEAMMNSAPESVIVEGYAGGLAMMYNYYLGEWMMFFASPSHADYKNGGIHLRVAKTLDGVWSEPVLVMAQSVVKDNGDGTSQGYGPVYEPRVCKAYQNGNKMMLISSSWDIYQSIVWEIELAKK